MKFQKANYNVKQLRSTVAIKCMYCVGVAVRLVEGNSYNEGRLEVRYNGQWGSVCYYRWNYRDTYVICRQLGFGTSGNYYSSYLFGRGSGPVWLEDLGCTGSESTIASCGHPGFNVTRSCRNNHEDVGIRCYGSQGTVRTIAMVHYIQYSAKKLIISFYTLQWYSPSIFR